MLVRLRKDKKGFTLVELIVVIAILGVLAMLIVPRIVGNVSEAKKEREISNARTLASEITIYNASHPDAQIENNTLGYVTSAEYLGPTGTPTGLTLTNITWPDKDDAQIVVDANGNASIKIVSPAP